MINENYYDLNTKQVLRNGSFIFWLQFFIFWLDCFLNNSGFNDTTQRIIILKQRSKVQINSYINTIFK